MKLAYYAFAIVLLASAAYMTTGSLVCECHCCFGGGCNVGSHSNYLGSVDVVDCTGCYNETCQVAFNNLCPSDAQIAAGNGSLTYQCANDASTLSVGFALVFVLATAVFAL